MVARDDFGTSGTHLYPEVAMSADATNIPLSHQVSDRNRRARDQSKDDPHNPLYFLLAVVSLWGCAILTWGLPALYLPAVALVPLCIAALVAITRG
jgi:hypothetical protein